MDPKISHSFWSDPDLVNLPPEDQKWVRYTVLWMITNPATSMAGIFRVAPKLFEFQTGLEAAWLERTLTLVPKMFVRDGEAVLIRNFVRYQAGSGPSLLRNNLANPILRALRRATPGLIAPFLELYPDLEGLWRATQALAKPLPSPSEKSSENEETQLNRPQTELPNKPLPSPYQALTKGRRGEERRVQVPVPFSTGECEGGAVIPTEAEVVDFCQGAAGIPPEYGRDYHRWRDNNILWINHRGQLIRWRKDLTDRWNDKRATWKPSKTAATENADLEARLQTETDPARRKALRAQLKGAR